MTPVLDDAIAPAILREIQTRLGAIEADEGVRMLMAVESGSRAWGLADEVLDGRALAHHSANLGRSAADRWLDGADDVPVKKYFYALQPALAIRCLRYDPASRPPMNLQALIAVCDLSEEVARDIAVLVAAKRRTNGARIPRLDALIRSELTRAPEVPEKSRPDDKLLTCANELFLGLVNS